MDVVVVACRAGLATVFFVAFVSKVHSRAVREAFVASLHTWRLLPSRYVGPVAAATVTAEAVVVALLVTPVTTTARVGFGLAAGLFGVFTVAVVTALRRGATQPCRCFGVTAAPLGRRHVVRNLVLVAAALVGFVGGPGGSGAAVALGLGTGVVAAMLIVMLDEFVAVFGKTTPADRRAA
jgi:hypothetical protein